MTDRDDELRALRGELDAARRELQAEVERRQQQFRWLMACIALFGQRVQSDVSVLKLPKRAVAAIPAQNYVVKVTESAHEHVLRFERRGTAQDAMADLVNDNDIAQSRGKGRPV